MPIAAPLYRLGPDDRGSTIPMPPLKVVTTALPEHRIGRDLKDYPTVQPSQEVVMLDDLREWLAGNSHKRVSELAHELEQA